MISPREVVDELSFARRKKGAPIALANPPATPPPPPPQDEDDDMKYEGDPLLPPSYQHGTSNGNSRAAALPTIRHYDEQFMPATTYVDASPRRFFGRSGDASLRPNTGETNSYDTALFGLALHELLENLRLANIIAAVASMGSLLASWFLRLVTAQLGKLVLAGYLAFLSFVLLMVEMLSIFHVASIDARLKENFGLLRHPMGKTMFIYLLATLCWGIGGLMEMIIGVVYFLSATVLFTAWVTYPEFRRPFEDEDKEEDEGQKRPPLAPRSASWSQYSSSFSTFVRTSSEHASLIGSALRKHESV